MLTRFFSNLRVESLALAITLSYALASLIWLPAFSVIPDLHTIFGALNLGVLLVKLLAFIFLPLLATGLNAVLNQVGLIKKNFIALVVINPLMLLGFYYMPDAGFVVLTAILVWVCTGLFRLSGNKQIEETLFKGGLLIGLCMIFNPQVWPLLFVYIIALIAYGAINIRYLLLPFFGTGAFLFNLFVWPYIFGSALDIKSFTEQLIVQFSGFQELGKSPRFIIFILAVGLAEYLTGLGKAKIVKRQFMGVVIYNIGLSVIGFIFLKDGNYWIAVCLLFGGILLSNAINYLQNKWIRDGLLLSLIAYVLMVYLTT